MAPSESQKRASLKWDKENMIVLGCKVKRKTSNTVLKEYVLDCIGESDDQEEGGANGEHV